MRLVRSAGPTLAAQPPLVAQAVSRNLRFIQDIAGDPSAAVGAPPPGPVARPRPAGRPRRVVPPRGAGPGQRAARPLRGAPENARRFRRGPAAGTAPACHRAGTGRGTSTPATRRFPLDSARQHRHSGDQRFGQRVGAPFGARRDDRQPGARERGERPSVRAVAPPDEAGIAPHRGARADRERRAAHRSEEHDAHPRGTRQESRRMRGAQRILHRPQMGQHDHGEGAPAWRAPGTTARGPRRGRRRLQDDARPPRERRRQAAARQRIENHDARGGFERAAHGPSPETIEIEIGAGQGHDDGSPRPSVVKTPDGTGAAPRVQSDEEIGGPVAPVRGDTHPAAQRPEKSGPAQRGGAIAVPGPGRRRRHDHDPEAGSCLPGPGGGAKSGPHTTLPGGLRRGTEVVATGPPRKRVVG